MAAIEFFDQDVTFKPSSPRKTKRWIQEVVRKERNQLVHLNYIFCSDNYLLSINQEYLGHKTLTDIITFDNSDDSEGIEGDVFISIDRVKANAESIDIPFDEELRRVIIHGALHLLGYKDKTQSEKALMRKKEDAYLSLYRKL
jgi:rRNA maturation RNase YbeY